MDSPNMPSLPPPPRLTRLPCLQSGTPSSLNQIVISKPTMNEQLLPVEAPQRCRTTPIEGPILRKPRRTNMLIWVGAFLCLFFCLVLILFGIGTLVIFVSVKPRYPVFDTPAATLNLVYLNSMEYLNGDLTFIANFSNPNKKLDMRFEYAEIELYFSNSLISTQALQPFTQRPKETRMVSLHLISSLVYMPRNVAVQLQKQVQSNRIIYNIRGTFRVRANLGIIHFSYWLHGRCQLELTSPPNGGLVTHTCTTKR